jgi:hypothetical protein
MTYRIDAAEVRRALELFLLPEQVTELRLIDAEVDGEWGKRTFSGYFDREHIDALIESLLRVKSAFGAYFVPNPIKSELLARSYNRARLIKDKTPTTSDKDVLQRRWLLIDADSIRASDISSTDAEKAAAEEVIIDVDHWLFEQGFPPGIIGDSGNGYHLSIPVDLPTDDKGFCERMLKTLKKKFSTVAVKIDETTFNPARIWKLYGSEAHKGDDCPTLGRTWRQSRIVNVCQQV